MTKTLRLLVLGALFLIPFIPLYVADGMFFPFITGKGFVFRILVEIAALSWLVLAIADVKYRPRFSWLLVLYGALTVWMFVADLLAINPHKAFWSNYERMDGWVTLVHMFLLFVVSSSVLTTLNLWRKWWLTFLAGATLVCGYGLLQIMGVLETHQGGRVDATFGNAAYLPAYLLFGIAIALWQALQSKGWLRHSLFVLLVVQVFVLLFTATRGALFGLVGALVFGALLFASQSRSEGRKIAAGILVGIALITTVFYAVKDTDFVRQDLTLSRLASVFTLSKELGVRTEIWGIAFTGVAKRPLIGYGHEGFNYVFNEHYRSSLFAQEQWFDRAHNVFLDWLVAGGVPAALLFICILVYAALALFRKEFSPVERVTILGAFVAYAIQGLVVFDNLFTYVPLAMLLAYIHARISTPISVLDRIKEAKSTNLYAPVIGIALIGAIVVWVINVPGITGSAAIIASFTTATNVQASMQELERAIATGTFATQEVREQMIMRATEAMVRPDVLTETKQSVITTAYTEMGKELARMPHDARLRLQYATLFRFAGDFDGALREIDLALLESPKKQSMLIERGTTLWQAGRFKDARADFVKAYELDTSFAQVAAYAAAGEILIGRALEGEAILAKHFDASLTGAPNVVLLAYQHFGDTASITRILQARAEKAGNTVEARFQSVSVLAQMGLYAQAKNQVAAIVEAYPQTASAAGDWLKQIDALQ